MQRGKVDEEVVGPTAAQLLMAMLQFKPLAHPSAAQALHMPFFSQQPQDMLQDVPQTGAVSCIRLDPCSVCWWIRKGSAGCVITGVYCSICLQLVQPGGSSMPLSQNPLDTITCSPDACRPAERQQVE